jgi:hypothetical protein
MIAELITPLMLATAPMTVTALEPLTYSHEKQVITQQATQLAQGWGRPQTLGATRTYDFNGRPNDSDND